MKTRSMKDAATSAAAAGNENAERITDLSRSLLTKAMASPQKAMEANLAAGSEIFLFMSRRLQAQAELWNKLAHCHAAEEALGVQREFTAGLTKDYSAEATYLAEMTADIAQKNFQNFAKETSEAIDEVASETEAAEKTVAEVA